MRVHKVPLVAFPQVRLVHMKVWRLGGLRALLVVNIEAVDFLNELIP